MRMMRNSYKGMDDGPIDKKTFRAWRVHAAQAKRRNEIYELSCEDWAALWFPDGTRDLWEKRGRETGDLVLARVDITGPWTRDNSRIVTRGPNWKKNGSK